MDQTASLKADLATLAETLVEPGFDLAAALEQLLASALRAVPSLLGLSLVGTTSEGGPALNLVAMTREGRAGHPCSSLRVPMPSSSIAAGPHVALVLYASSPGAFVDLAADISYLRHQPIPGLVLDAHPVAAEHTARLSDLQVLVVVNRAIGVLVERGLTVDEATRQLGQPPGSRSDAALAVLAGLADHPRSE